MQRSLTHDERVAWLRLWRSQNVGAVGFLSLLRRFGSAEAALEVLPRLARRGGREARVATREQAERELAALDRLGCRLIALTEPDYPQALAAIPDPPPLLTVRGRIELLARPAVAIVGARNASLNGRHFARGLAGTLGAAGWVVASGLARGIDTAAHEGALDAGTVAVVAGGIDVIYPPENARLHERIAAAGAIVSECAPGTAPTPRHFPQRNRIISGLSAGVVVVEAAQRSGSLITARLAGEQGRLVMAVPGSPMDPRAEGANHLIRSGATLIRSADDVVEELSGALPASPPRLDLAEPPVADADVDALRGALLAALSPAPVAVDALQRDLGAPAAAIGAALVELELAGRIQRHPGNQVSLVAE